MFEPGSMLYTTGRFGPFITFIMTLVILKNKSFTTQAYIAGVVMETIINPLIKLVVGQRRPDRTNSTSMLSAALDTSKNPQDINYPDSFIESSVDSHRYGMPSGHAQTSAFNLMYIWLVTHHYGITAVYAVFALITCIQRVVSRRHYVDQVLVGSVIGALIAYFSFVVLTGILKSI